MAESSSTTRASRANEEAPSYSGDAFEINVEDLTFHVPKGLICRTSNFFKNAAKPEWTREGGPRPIVLEDDTADAFSLYAVWLYNGSIERADSNLKTWQPLSEAYVMGERIMDSQFQDAIFEAMYKRCQIKDPSIVTMNKIYEGTSPPSPARNLIIDICVYKNRKGLETIDDPVAELHEDLVRDLLHALIRLSKPSTFFSPLMLDFEEYQSKIEQEQLSRMDDADD